MQATTDDRSRRLRRTVLGALLGGAAGFAGAFAMLQVIDAGMLGHVGGSQTIALLVALIYLLMGFAAGFGVLSPRLGAHFLNVEDAAELDEQRAMLAPNAAACVLLAVALAVLALAGPGGVLAPLAALGAGAVAIAASVWLTKRSLGQADELMRQVMRDSAAASFYLAFAALGGWAALAWLGLALAPTMLDVVTLLYAVALIGCFWVIARRGMMVR